MHQDANCTKTVNGELEELMTLQRKLMTLQRKKERQKFGSMYVQFNDVCL